MYIYRYHSAQIDNIRGYARAERVVDGPLQAALRTFNKATSEAALDLIQSNRWLGEDFSSG